MLLVLSLLSSDNRPPTHRFDRSASSNSQNTCCPLQNRPPQPPRSRPYRTLGRPHKAYSRILLVRKSPLYQPGSGLSTRHLQRRFLRCPHPRSDVVEGHRELHGTSGRQGPRFLAKGGSVEIFGAFYRRFRAAFTLCALSDVLIQ
jgi:hypothetical protein